jgi:sterol desaturase/sphingolipid hydroxylase (fatty acid hydroxylase superfamily)
MNAQHDSIEAALRVHEPALPDDDFSTSVLARLPLRRRRSTVRRWTVAGSAALGSVLTLAFAAPLETVLASIAPWDIPPVSLSTVAMIAIVAVPALFVFYSERADR